MTIVRPNYPCNRRPTLGDPDQHHGGDLNPSWDDATGMMVLLPELYAHGRDQEGPVVLFDAEIRARLRAGANIFTTGDLLVR